MMREHKYRAWNEYKKEMTYFHPIAMTDSGDALACQSVAYEIDYYIDTNTCEPDEKIVIEQFTGLRDKNKKEAYFGDLLKTKIGEFEYIREVKSLDNGTPYIELPTVVSNTDQPCVLWEIGNEEIVGNIHEK